MEFPHVLDISILYTCNLHLLFVFYYKIVMYLSNQSKAQALSVKMVKAEIKSKLKIIILKYKICMHKLSFYVCQESRQDFSCYQNIFSEDFLLKICPCYSS